jgi:hypothetical protein
MKTLAIYELPYQNFSQVSYLCHFLSSAHLSLDGGKIRAFFTVTGGFLNAATSSLKRVPERTYEIRERFQRSKYLISLALRTQKKNLKTTSAYTERTGLTPL